MTRKNEGKWCPRSEHLFSAKKIMVEHWEQDVAHEKRAHEAWVSGEGIQDEDLSPLRAFIERHQHLG